MAVEGAGSLTGGGEGLDRIDCHPVDGGIEVSDAKTDGATDPDKRDKPVHAPVE